MKPGVVIGGLVFIGGAVVLWSLMSTTINMPLLVTGVVFLVIGLVVFIKELMKI